MAGFYRNQGQLWVDGTPLAAVAEAFDSPCYVYSAAKMAASYQAIATVFSGPNRHIHYAMKANSNLAVLKLFHRLGANVDLVSIGEYHRALAAGFTPDQMVFSGVGKTEAELREAIIGGIGQINAESAAEVDSIITLAKETGMMPSVALRINPDVAAGGHAKISTGGSDTKFGIPGSEAEAIYRRMIDSQVIRPSGLAVHIGSQIMDFSSFAAAWQYMRDLADHLKTIGCPVPNLDLGGGIGVDYSDGSTADLVEFAAIVKGIFGTSDYHLAIEPGRLLVAEAGCLLTRVINVKSGKYKRFIGVDGAMNDLIRPTLYESFHRIEAVGEHPADPIPADIVGPVCETGDYLGLGRDMPSLKTGDVVAVMSAGAYGAVMRSNYNSRPLANEVMVVNGTPHLISKPQRISDLLAADIIPTAIADFPASAPQE